MGKAKDVEVGLVDRIDHILEPDRQMNEATEAWDIPRESDDDSIDEEDERKTRQEKRDYDLALQLQEEENRGTETLRSASDATLSELGWEREIRVVQLWNDGCHLHP